jgi:hypothetical protein
MQRIKRVLLVAFLAMIVGGGLTTAAQAAGKIPAGLELANGAPNNGKVAATVIGKSFWPKERVHVTYQVTVRGVSKRSYQFDTRTDRFGAFFQKVAFNLSNRHYGYILKATAVGVRGDRATLNTWASGQG